MIFLSILVSLLPCWKINRLMLMDLVLYEVSYVQFDLWFMPSLFIYFIFDS